MSLFKITIGATVLCDDAASPKNRGVIEQFGAQSGVQEEDVYNSDFKFLAPLGNVAGEFVFSEFTSYATLADAAAAYAAATALLNIQDTVVLIYGSATLTMANALLYKVERVEWGGVGLRLRYGIKYTTLVAS